MRRSCVTVVLRFDPARARELRSFLDAGSFHHEDRPHALFLARREGVTLTAFKSGKIVITGPQDEEYAGVLVGKGLATRESAAPPPTLAPTGEEYILNFDGLCDPVNPGGVATYGFLVRHGGRVIHEAHGLASPPRPTSSNNVAEYGGLIAALRWLVDAGLQDAPAIIRGDSKLIILQARGDWGVKSANLRALNEEARRLLALLPRARLEWVPREQNAEADELSRAGYRAALAKHPEWARITSARPATANQLNYLRGLGVAPPAGLTVEQASQLIEDAKRRSSQE